jgi:hypothetical protein
MWPSLSISPYVTEAVAATVEGKLKAADVPAAVEVVSMLHQTYAVGRCRLTLGRPCFISGPKHGVAET